MMNALYVFLPRREEWPATDWGAALRSHLSGPDRMRQAESSYALGAKLMGYEQPPAPAGVRRALSHHDAEDAYWLLAEPAHCRADLTDAFVVGLSTRLDLSLEDAIALASEAEADLPAQAKFQINDSGIWFVRLSKRPKIETRTPEDVVGQSLGDALPIGDEGAHWTQALNAIQITWHNSEVNQRRITNNLVAVNALLLWGEGAWPVQKQASSLSVATKVGPLNWLARFSGCNVCEPAADISSMHWVSQLDILDLSRADKADCTTVLGNPATLFRSSGKDNIVWVEPDGSTSTTTRRAWWRFWDK